MGLLPLLVQINSGKPSYLQGQVSVNIVFSSNAYYIDYKIITVPRWICVKIGTVRDRAIIEYQEHW